MRSNNNNSYNYTEAMFYTKSSIENGQAASIHPWLKRGNDASPMETAPILRSVAVRRDSPRFFAESSPRVSSSRRIQCNDVSANRLRSYSETCINERHRARLFHNNATVVSRRSNITTTTMKKVSNTEPSPRWSWELKVDDIMPVPLYHPLERSAIVLTSEPVETISAQISDFMRLNSITCHYYTNVGRVDCCTPKLLEFVVQLWKKIANDGEVQIIMEVQRRQGCSIEMQHLRTCLIKSILQRKSVSMAGSTGEYCGNRSPRQVGSFKTDDGTSSRAESNLKICVTLLESRMSDQNRLGLESLATLTQSPTVRKQDAEYVAKEVLYGQGKYGERLQNALAQFFQDTERPEEAIGLSAETEDMYDSDDEDEYSEYAQGRYFGVAHVLALQVLANALVVLGASTNSDDAPQQINMDAPFWQHVRSALEYNLSVGRHRAQEAALSAKCIRRLSELTPIELDHMLPILMEAHDYGVSHHLSLEEECRDLMGRVASVC